MNNFYVESIGNVKINGERFFIKLDSKYSPALRGLEGFGHLDILWWFSKFDTPQFRSILTANKPYKMSPEILGTFAMRSPVRPNPIALSIVDIISIDYEKGLIETSYIDAFDGSDILDIKPYTPSVDRIENPKVPKWCDHWPKCVESSERFDWDSEFNF